MNKSFILQKIWVTLIFALIISCESEQPEDMFPLNSIAVPGVSPIHSVDDNYFGCETSLFPADSSSRYCAILRGEAFELSDSAKYWLPQYAFEIGKEFTYINKNAESLKLILTEKKHLLVDRIAVKKTERCDAFSGKSIGTCNQVELLYVVLETESKELSVYLEIGSVQFGNSDTTYAPQGQLWLESSHTKNGNSQKISGQWIWPKELDKTGFVYELFNQDEEIKLLGQTFKDLVGRNDWFYSKEVGLVAFKDESEVFWVLQE